MAEDIKSQRCRKCKQELPMSEFWFNKGSGHWFRQCKDCIRRDREIRETAKRGLPPPPADFKQTCRRCRRSLHLSHFYRSAGCRFGYTKTCRQCISSAYKAKYRNKPPDWQQQRYGIKPGDYDRLYRKQHGCCAICGAEGTKKNGLHIDHDHKTGKVRALLCGNCNRGLGCFKEDIRSLRKAIRYLRKHVEPSTVDQDEDVLLWPLN